MNHSGDAAEQIVRMSLEGAEVAARITGGAAKEIAMLLLAAMKSPEKSTGNNLKLKGKARLESMLKSGKALEIFSVKESDLKKFYQGAKQYGIVYCVLRNTKHNADGLCDIMVKAEDAPKINRLVERFKFATVDKAKIESEIVAAKAEKAAGDKSEGAEPDSPEINDTEKLVDDLLGTPEGKSEPEETETEKSEAEMPDKSDKSEKSSKEPTDRPLDQKPPRSYPSEPISKSRSSSAKVSSKPSVKEEIREIKAAQKKRETDAPARDDKAASDKPRANTSTTHKQPINSTKPKSRKTKERT